MDNRYTYGETVRTASRTTMYRILDNGVPTGAIGSYSAIRNMYDECEVTGGEFHGITGEYYSGTYTCGEFGMQTIYGGEFTDGAGDGITGIYDHYLSESGDRLYV